MAQLPTPPFTVRTLYQYDSDHPDDLPFKEGMTINVLTIEDDQWMSGFLTTDPTARTGMFPRNFVEVVQKQAAVRPEPEPELRTGRQVETEPESERVHEEQHIAPPAPAPAPIVTKQVADVTKKVEEVKITPKPVEASEPNPEPRSKPRNAFRDRIAAFNNQTESLPVPLFQQPKPSTFVKKPYIPPPSSYVPTIPKSPPPVQQPASFRATVEKHDEEEQEEDKEEEPVPKMSLQERIKMLQQQQKGEQERAEQATLKKKQRLKAKKDAGAAADATKSPTIEPLQQTVSGDSTASVYAIESNMTGESLQSLGKEVEVRQENAENIVEEQQPIEEQEEQEEKEDDEEDEEDEEEDEDDEEEAKRVALRERMAKISGGMGMNLGMLLPGNAYGAPPPAKKKSAKPKPTADAHAEEVATHAAPVPMFPFADPRAIAGLGQHKQHEEDEEGEVETDEQETKEEKQAKRRSTGKLNDS